MPQTYKNFYFSLLLLGCIGVTAGCAPAAQPAPPSQPAAALVLPTVTAEATLVETPTAAPPAPPTTEPTPTTAQSDWTTTATVDGDYYVLGNPQAPIHLIDYSDFF